MATTLPEPGAADALYVIDLSSYLLRAYHAVAPLTSPSGEPTQAVFGLVTMLERLIRLQAPRLVVVCMDAGRVTFRHEIFDRYKANRPPQPPDLRIQMGRAEELVRKGGFLVLKQDGVEADDLIASVVGWADHEGLRVVIVGADKDLMQLASERVLLWDTMQNRVFGPAEVREKFGVPPSQLGDLLAMTGDSSDNIPGIPSVGPKTAAKLLLEYGDLESVLGNASNVPQKKLKEMLLEHAEAARLSRRLVELRADCPLELSRLRLEAGHGPERDDAGIVGLFEELGFTRQLAVLKAGGSLFGATHGPSVGRGPGVLASSSKVEPVASSSDPPSWQGVPPLQPKVPPLQLEVLPPQVILPAVPATTTPGQPPDPRPFNLPIAVLADPLEFRQWLGRLEPGPLGFEAFTLSPESHRGPLVAVCITHESGAAYLPLAHRNIDRGSPFPREELLPSLKSVGASRFVCFHAKRQRVLLETALGAGASDALELDDLLLAAYLVDPERRHSLESLALEVGRQLDTFEVLSKQGKLRRDHDELSEAEVAPWAAQRGSAILSAFRALSERLIEFGLDDLYRKVEVPLGRMLSQMEQLGVLVDTRRLAELGEVCDRELARLEAEAIRVAGKEFNVNSPRQLETILFDELGLKPQKRTKTARSTDAQTLEVLSEEHPLPEIILEHRQIAKLKSTYLDALPSLVDGRTGRVHSAWEQAVAATGRISSVDPNLQNIPIRSELGRKIRAAFIAPPGYQLVSADYSQIELRILAHLSQDERLLEAFRTGQDVHLRTAMEIFEVAEDQVTREMRSRAKAVNFGIIYGQGESGLAKATHIERKVAAEFIAKYFQRYQGVRNFLDLTLAKAREGETVTTLLGRRRILPDIRSGNRARRLAAERVATNLPIQGSAADILKLAMLKFDQPVTPGARLILTVHDELVFEVPHAEVETAKPEIVARMSSAYQLLVPLEVTAGSGPDWNSAH